ncbi:MAG: glycerophosphodiester phosphodiesterase [Opitutales bacterium]|nr:glycerophosphodiester phosphodiesterase [Opitutales bacterium]MBT6769030.1 glycerophosphodiester phosphodiesterase [Opitutales bacterium]
MSPLVFAHRGFSLEAPENTMAAFRLGWQSGASGVECDVHLTADSKIVCIHDYDTGRVSDRKIKIAESDWSELASLEVGEWKDSKWKGESIPRLRDLLAAIPEDKVLVIELKCGPEVVAPLVGLIDESGRDQESLLVISFNEKSLVELKRVRSTLNAYWLSDLDVHEDGLIKPSIAEILDTLDRLGVDGFGGQSGEGISQSLVDALDAKGYALNVWTVDDAEEVRRMKRIGVTSVTSNDPRSTIDALER